MAALTLTVSAGSPATQIYSGAFAASDGDLVRIIQAYQQAANINTNGVATETQVLTYILSQWLQMMNQQVASFTLQQAQAAIPPVTPVVVTPST